MDYFSKHKEGLVTTILVHLILIFIFFKVGLFTPVPVLQDRGVLLDFGMTDEGMGETEPTPKESAPAKPYEGVPISKPVTKTKSQVKQPVNEEHIETQDFEESAAIKEAKKNLENQKRQENLKRDSLQRINEERIAEQNRVAEIRRQDSIKEAAKQASINQINSRAKNAFGVSGKGTDPNSTGQGTGYKPGNQGSPDGVANGGDGSGTGQGSGNGNGNGRGTGVSSSLKGRTARGLPKPSYPGNEEGVVVVEVTVDKSGRVTKAVAGVMGTKTLNAGLLEAARKAALMATFNENSNAPELQTGTITYHFVLN
jgi:colicin import membrane protein